jgi:hypothetical protein
MDELLSDLLFEFRRHKSLADRAMAALDDGEFFRRPLPHVNPVAVIVKHMAGNLLSRWTDFRAADGDKPARDRDGEFVLTDADARASLLAAWDRGWAAVVEAVQGLAGPDLERSVTIRSEPHTVRQALLRGLTHAAYHTGQILYVARLVRPDAPWLTIAPGQSSGHAGAYRKPAP